MPTLVDKILKNIFVNQSIILKWPAVNVSEIEEDDINLPIQINGKFAGTFKVLKDYDDEKILEQVINVAKFKERIKDNPIKKTIHVKNKILNIII